MRSVLRSAAIKIIRTVDPRACAVFDLFVQPYETWVDWRSGLNDAALVLYAIARAIRPTTIVEIGSARGKSTCTLALACSHNDHGTVHAIDPHCSNDWSELSAGLNTETVLRDHLAKYELKQWVDVHVCTSAEAATTWTTPIDLLFIDGDHSFDGVHDTTWEQDTSHRGYRADMGVPRFMRSLQALDFHSVTIPQVPGLTILHSRPGGFDFLSTGTSGGEAPESAYCPPDAKLSRAPATSIFVP
jgi:hypothetical protein